MKILWISNVLFPDVCKELGIKTHFAGGWMSAGANALINIQEDCELAVASIYDGDDFRMMEVNKISYFLLPKRWALNMKKLSKIWKEINRKFNPDIIHIHGTEYPHSLSYIKSSGSKNVVVSIQGLVNVCARYFLGGIEESTLLLNITLRDLLRRDNIFLQKKNMEKRAILEIETISLVDDLIGRTDWDKTHIWSINPTANYHFCNETLRDSFYQGEWKYESCEKHSIFLSQGHYPLKGLHKMLEAMPLVVRQFPNTKLYIAGTNFLQKKTFLLSGYAKYVKELIKSKGLENNVFFTGALDEREMSKKYVESNIFVCPSSIENSSNSVGEAQLLGVPCIAANVGGMSNLIEHGVNGFMYRFDESEQLARLICTVFESKELQISFSKKGRVSASQRHDKIINAQRLIDIYKNIQSKNYQEI